MSFSKPRGTQDIYFEDSLYFNKVVDVLKQVSKIFNYSEILTPIFESKDLFVRNIGATTDIVTKEFYDFKDKGDRDLVLRPENTVGVIRAVVENKLALSNPLPLNFFYIGPMFRYERPQNGRYRQFYQFGIEKIGIKNVYDQIEAILLSNTILKTLNIKQYKLKINFIGDIETREKWINELKKYFSKFKDNLTQDSINRIDKNPLRILDDKIDGEKQFVKDAPKIDKYLTNKEKEEVNEIIRLLKSLDIEFEFDRTMVRGLDYYCGLVFEFISTSNILIGQSTLIGGGKYSKLVEEIGGPNLDCVGFGLGIDRIIIAYKNENQEKLTTKIDLYIASIGDDQKVKDVCFILNNLARLNGLVSSCNNDLSKLDKHFKYAEKLSPRFIAILGKKELEKNIVILKDQTSKKEETINLLEFVEKIKNK
ncbi:histidine--tRNA ligase [Malacoplasma iowae]|uniref:Histidine--tRNA ligase n=1 Tax=Malacoplasma iowae 695 TaxID=1048830 RepID=A0A6P1LE02_MALIO|nr:histidine--tRNA ligase [Malacoplasma iowae]VEU62350.1 histidyl-tRNA synthetase [Mycoplasmopsis fermentans]EGZ31535.1 histidyl-tRNA synthetase [Malacoplasma iowae 695]QHG89824.1 histidine--tRNA ligase [Malacoplasma iowae 695]WPL35367.1 histidine--tRNA ligase [Malacoplasma iowae]VEU72410.1 histidyl-tRNA synthetase [Malacoplasma iowae]